MTASETRHSSDEMRYNGELGRTGSRPSVYNCTCGFRYPMDVYTSIDISERADLVQQLLDGNLNQGTCPQCGTHSAVDSRCVLHDPTRPMLLLYLPETMRHAEMDARASLLDDLASDPADGLPEYAIDFDVVFGPSGLREALTGKSLGQRGQKLAEREQKLEGSAREVAQKKAQLEEQARKVQGLEQDLVEQKQKLRSRESDLNTRADELARRVQDLDRLKGELERQAADLASRQKHVEEFERQLAMREKKIADQEQQVPTRAGYARDVESDSVGEDSVFAQAARQPSPTLEQSVEQALASGPASGPPEQEAPIAISDEDVVEEEQIIEEPASPAQGAQAPIAEARVSPAAPVSRQAPDEAASKSVKAKKQPSRTRRQAASQRGLDEEAREHLRGGDRRFVRQDGRHVELFAVTGDDAMFQSSDRTSVRFRVHQMDDSDGYPWIVLSAAIRPPGARAHLFRWLLDYRVRVHRRILGRLSEKCLASITLTTADLDREVSFKAANRIEGNIKSLAADLEKHFLDNPDLESPRKVDEKDIMGRLLEELKKPFPFHGRYVEEHTSHAGIVSALADLHRWGTGPNVRRLVRIYSFPLEGIATIKRRILTRAVSAGIDLPGVLPEDAVSMGLADDVPALLQHSLSAFLATCREGTDLTRDQVAENWGKLMDAAGRHEVPVSLEVAEMARDYLGDEGEAIPHAEEIQKADALPLADVDDEMLLRWLHRPSRRSDVALELVGRGGEEHLQALSEAMGRMDGADLEVLTPRLIELDEVGETFFLDGLKSDSALLRIASALALGKMKLRTAVVPLITAMCEHEEPEWKVQALALSRYSTAAVRMVEQFLRNPRGCEERLVFLTGALAMAGCDGQIQAMAQESDLTLASLAQKGWDRRHQVQMEMDALLKGSDDDVVAAFIKDLDDRMCSG